MTGVINMFVANINMYSYCLNFSYTYSLSFSIISKPNPFVGEEAKVDKTIFIIEYTELYTA